MKNIATVGGGTGHYSLLRGLKNYDIHLDAIVSVADNGGSTGSLRTEFGVLAPGDLRNCLVALSDEAEIKELAGLFEYRFSGSQSFGDHNVGNIILTALSKIHGNMADAVNIAGKLLRVKGNVLPVSLDNSELYAKTDSGRILKGELEVSYPGKSEKITELWLEPQANIYRESAKAIRNSDMIVICPGDLYGSILPNFITKGFAGALAESKAKIVYVCNLVTKQGTYGFKSSDFVSEIEKYSGKKLDYIICNSKRPTKEIVDKYRQETSFFVETDSLEERVCTEDLLIETVSGGKTVVRHDSEKISRIVMSLI